VRNSENYAATIAMPDLTIVTSPIDPTPDAAPASAPAPAGPLFRIDPGWLFLIAGAALLSATVLVPAVDDLSEAAWHRDRAMAVERYRTRRLENYTLYLDALERADPTVVLSLAATELNLAPADRLAVIDASENGLPGASVFPALEPEFAAPGPRARPRSLLQRWATDERARLWLIAGGALCVLLGLLPAARRGAPPMADVG